MSWLQPRCLRPRHLRFARRKSIWMIPFYMAGSRREAESHLPSALRRKCTMNIPDLVIREIRARPGVAPLPRPIRTGSGDVLDAPLLLMDVLTDAGVTGRAYAFAYTRLTLLSLAQFV